MGYFILAVVAFVVGLIFGFIKGYRTKEKIVSFSLMGGLVVGLSVVSLLIIAGLRMGGINGDIGDLARVYILSGGITFITLYAGAWITGVRKKDSTERNGIEFPDEEV